jgi:hypothetical protein
MKRDISRGNLSLQANMIQMSNVAHGSRVISVLVNLGEKELQSEERPLQ